MADIRPYTERVTAQGGLNVQANPADFGAGVGAAVQNLGNAGMEYADTMYKQQVQQELTKVYTDTSDAQVQLMTALKQQSASAAPGDLTFVSSFKQTIDGTMEKLASNYTTPAAQREFAHMSASINRDFLAQAIAQQSKLVSDGVRVDNAKISTDNGSVVFSNPAMLESVIQRRLAQIDNPESMYAQLPRSERERLKAETEQDLRKAAKTGEIVANPELFLAKVSPETLQKFNRSASTVANFTTTTPTVNDKVAGLAPTIQENAAKYGVDANIITAQIMAESKGRTGDVSPKGAKGISQFMDDTAKQYGVDVTNDASSIRGQANMMSDLLKQFGGDYPKALAAYNWGSGNLQNAINKYGVNWMAAAPAETRNYVASILKNAGVQAVTGQPPVYDTTPVKVGDPDFDRLPWHDQYQLVQLAQQHVNANQVRDHQRIADAERQRKLAESDEMKNMLVKLENGQLTPDTVLQSKVLDASSTMVMLNAIRAKTSKLDDTDPRVMNDVLTQVTSGQVTDPQSLWGYIGKGLSLTDIQKMQAIVNGKGSPLVEKRKSFMSMAKTQISGANPMMGIQDPEGDKQYYAFLNELDQVIEEKQKTGVTLSQMLDAGANNREYLGYLIDKYKRSPQQRMNAAANIVRNSAANVTTNAAPRQPGETIDQYLARTGNK
jgi:soluble lytic murein transglycosylase-like protein